MRNVSDKSCRENQNTHFVFNNFSSKNRAVCEIMWKNIVEPGKLQMTIRRMRLACLIPKATDTHSEYAILVAFPPQQWLHERVSLLRYSTLAVLLHVFKKAVPLQSWSGPEGSRKLRFPDYMTTAQDGDKAVSPTHRPNFTPRK